MLDRDAVAGHGAVLAAPLLLKKYVSSFCIGKSYLHFFHKNTCEFGIVLTRTLIILTSNGLIKLTML